VAQKTGVIPAQQRAALREPGSSQATSALSASIESERRSGFLIWSHFLRKTGTRFSGKCSTFKGAIP
jgi:hypothetical protein